MIKQLDEILNLRTNESIGKELADRQLNVIRSAYDYLRKPENTLIYIADEVGLGKTYIAAWILRRIVYHLLRKIVYQCFSPKFTTLVCYLDNYFSGKFTTSWAL
jgi:hypothetical protein